MFSQIVSIDLQPKHKKVALALSLAAAVFSTTSTQVMAADNANLDPEVESNVWEENDQECASVTALNQAQNRKCSTALLPRVS